MKEYIGTDFHRQTSWGRKIGPQIHQNRGRGIDKPGQLIYSHNSGSSRRNSKDLITNMASLQKGQKATV